MSYLLEAARIDAGLVTKNSSGRAIFRIDEWKQLERFLILGTSEGSYYASREALTAENSAIVKLCLAQDPERTVALIKAISVAGRNPKQDTVLYALAMAASHLDPISRAAAFSALPEICRTASHLFQFISYADAMRGWGMGFRKALLRWIFSRDAGFFAFQTVKYGTRNGWSMRDVLRKVKPARRDIDSSRESNVELFDTAFGIVAGKKSVSLARGVESLEIFANAEEAKTCPADSPRAIALAGLLPHEAIPNEWKSRPEIWTALLPNMGLTAMVRNFATMTRAGVFRDRQNILFVVDAITDKEKVRKSRVHPAQMLAAWLTYKSGRSVRGDNTWTPVPDLVEALEHGFYAAFGNVDPIGNRVHVGLDVSGSMARPDMLGIPGLSPRVASAALTMIHWRTENKLKVNLFSDHFKNFDLKSLDRATRFEGFLNHVSNLPFQRTDCSVPMRTATKHSWEVDTFIIYTDSETNTGGNPMESLREYRRASGINAKLITVGMVSTSFTVGDPNDGGTLDVVGFDLATPNLIADFARQD